MSDPNLCAGPGQQQQPMPSFGSLKDHEPLFYIAKLTDAQLRQIISTTPSYVRKDLPTTATKEHLVAEVLRIRDHELKVIPTSSSIHAKRLETLLNTNPPDILQLSKENPQTLKDLMKSALIADPTLEPAIIPSDSNEAAAIAITWQFSTFRKFLPANQYLALQTQPSPQQPPSQVSQLLASSLPHGPQPNDVENLPKNVDEPPRKRIKRRIQPTDFSGGLSSAQEKGLSHYPGKGVSSTNVMVDELMGPFILLHLIADGTDIPTFLTRSFRHWHRPRSGRPTAAEIEAQFIGRLIHIELLMYPSPKEALEQRPSLEIALRRLFAILYVEETVSIGEHPNRREAWVIASQILEQSPQCTMRSLMLPVEVTESMSIQRRRMTAIRAIRETLSKQPPRSSPARKSRCSTQPQQHNRK